MAALFLPGFLPDINACRGWAICAHWWYKLVIVPSKPHEAPDLSDSGGGWPYFDHAYFLFVSCYTLGGDDMSQVCDLSAKEIAF